VTKSILRIKFGHLGVNGKSRSCIVYRAYTSHVFTSSRLHVFLQNVIIAVRLLMGTSPSTIASHTTSCAAAHLSSARCSSTAATLAKWNSQQDLLNPLQKTEVVSNHDKHDVSRYRSLAGLANLPNSGSDLEEILPRELWELTLSFCCDRQLAVDIPLTCKYFYGLCNEDCAIWKQKSIAKFNLTVEEILSLDTTWKRHYHCSKYLMVV
jgi:hypothetical protein